MAVRARGQLEMGAFEPLPKAHFRLETSEGVPKIIIPARRNWFVLIFIPFWLAIWTVGGMAAFYDLLANPGSPRLFLTIWLIGWAIGWLFAASWLGWNISGREELSVTNDALVKGWRVLGFGREKRYDLSQIRGLSVGTPPFPYGQMRISYPPFLPMTFGPLKWNYGASTVYAASGLSEGEAEMILVELQKRLPVAFR